MQVLAILTAVFVGLAAAQQPAFRFSPYGNGDTTCDADNLISPTTSIPGTGDVSSCVQLASGTSSLQYSLLEGSQAGCTVSLWTNNACNGPVISSYVDFTPPPPKMNSRVANMHVFFSQHRPRCWRDRLRAARRWWLGECEGYLPLKGRKPWLKFWGGIFMATGLP